MAPNNLPTNASGNRLPVPDPTPMTTEALERETKALREILETRMTGQDALIALMQNALLKRRSDITEEVLHLQTLHEEKFASVQKQFLERDVRTEQTQKDSKTAVDAALQAAKEAVGKQNDSNEKAIAKSEGGFTKQIDQILLMMEKSNKASDEKIADIRERQIAQTSHKTGEGDKGAEDRATRADSRANISMMIAAVLAMLSIGSAIYSATHVSPAPAPVQISTPANGASPQIIVVPLPTTPATTTK